MKLAKFKDKNIYERKMHVYKARREEHRARFGVENGKKAPEGYKLAVANINKKIRSWEHTIDDIEKRRNKTIALANDIALFMGITVKNIGASREIRPMLAKFIFCKYGMENGIPGVHLAEYMGINTRQASYLRMSFTKKLGQREYKEMWERWKKFLEDKYPVPIESVKE